MASAENEPHDDSASALSALSAPPLSIEFHPSIQFVRSADRGAGLRSTAPIPASEPIAKVPFTSTLSILNTPTIVPYWDKDTLEAFRFYPDVLTKWLLCEARVKGKDSPWHTYLDLLPKVFNTPLFWDETDRQWLDGTNLGGATLKREQQWKAEWEKGVDIEALNYDDISFPDGAASLPSSSSGGQKFLDEHDQAESNAKTAEQRQERRSTSPGGSGPTATHRPINKRRYKWELYKWAATVLSSRSFTQEVLRGWTPPTVSGSVFAESELNRRWHEDKGLTFPVLLPGLDLANHDPKVKAKWVSENDAITFTREDGVEGGIEVCNNYGVKGNEELLLGYGFMLDDNEHDFVVLATSGSKSSSYSSSKGGTQQTGSRLYHPFPQDDRGRPDRILQRSLLPADILKLARYAANKRELVTTNPTLPEMSSIPPVGTRRLTVMIDSFILSLEDRISRLEESRPEEEPTNDRQRLALMYRDSQVQILEANVEFLTNHLLTLPTKGRILTLSKLLSDSDHPVINSTLLDLFGEICGSKPKAKIIRARGWQGVAFALWICLVWLQWKSDSLDPGDDLVPWMRFLARTYKLEPGRLRSDLADVYALFDVPQPSAQAKPEGLLADEKLNKELLSWGLLVWRQESVVLRSLNRIVRNGDDEEHEDMLFLELQ